MFLRSGNQDVGASRLYGCATRREHGPSTDGAEVYIIGPLRAPWGPNFIKILVFGGFEGSGGAWGHHQSTREEKLPGGSYFREIWLDLRGFHADF